MTHTIEIKADGNTSMAVLIIDNQSVAILDREDLNQLFNQADDALYAIEDGF